MRDWAVVFMDDVWEVILSVIPVIIPIVVAITILAHSVAISERHHSHHDTYQIASTLTWSLGFTMIFMGALGTLLGWLCVVGVYETDIGVVLGFFDSFLIISFVYWMLLWRYKVVTYGDYLKVTPFVGSAVTVDYGDIVYMEWVPSLILAGGQNVHIHYGPHKRILLWGGLDLEQILVRIDRFDVFEDYAVERD